MEQNTLELPWKSSSLDKENVKSDYRLLDVLSISCFGLSFKELISCSSLVNKVFRIFNSAVLGF